MKILLVFDAGFSIDAEKLMTFLQVNLSHIKFTQYDSSFIIEDEIIVKNETFPAITEKIGKEINNYDRVFCFTTKQYNDNYFFHTQRNLSVFSFYGWSYLTDLPLSNGVIYFIIDKLALEIDKSEFRHRDTTGCVYDFLWDKKGVDDGMRQARFCANCLNRLSLGIVDETELKIFEDLKKLMNLLADASRWNKDILDGVEKKKANLDILAKRKVKNEIGVNIVIASPGDTEAERRVLLDSLERRFRLNNHEAHCGFRIIVNGWEDLASQNGYAQDVINQKIIAECDFVVAVFKHRLGTPTIDLDTGLQRAVSGTAEELLQALDKSNKHHPIGMAFFYSKAPVISLDLPEKDKIEKDWNRLTEFKKSIQSRMIYKPYTEVQELLETVLRDLEKNIMDYIEK